VADSGCKGSARTQHPSIKEAVAMSDDNRTTSATSGKTAKPSKPRPDISSLMVKDAVNYFLEAKGHWDAFWSGNWTKTKVYQLT
jgi:hypothetical protein